MEYILFAVCIIATIYCFTYKTEYVMAMFLVGQIILKLMLQAIPGSHNSSIYLLIYCIIGFTAFFLFGRCPGNKWVSNEKVEFIVLYMLFTVLLIFSLIYSEDRGYGLDKISEFILTSGIIVVLGYLTLKKKQDFIRLLGAITNISLITGVITLGVLYLSRGSFIARIGTTEGRALNFLGVSLSFSIWFGRRMGLGFISSLFLTRLKSTLLNKVKTAILFFMTLLSVSRGPILSLSITLLYLLWVSGVGVRFLRKYKKIILICIVVGVPLMLSYTMSSGIFQRLFTLSDRNAESRMDMYIMSIKIFLNNVAGVGAGGFKAYEEAFLYPHNIILEILVELGCIGLIIFGGQCIIAIKSIGYHREKAGDEEIKELLFFSSAVFLFAFINAQFSGSIASNEYIWLGMVLLVCIKNIDAEAIYDEQYMIYDARKIRENDGIKNG